MNNRMHLGKTADSRTRAKSKPQEHNRTNSCLLTPNSELQTFADYLLMKNYSTTTIKRYMNDAEVFLKWAAQENIPHEFIVYSDVLHYIQGRKKNLNQRSVSAMLNSLKHYFNFLEKTGQYNENPTTQIKIHGIKRRILYDILSHQELESLYNNFVIPGEESSTRNQNWFKSSVIVSKRNKVILGLMIYQGLNTHELGALTEKDLKLREGKIYIAGSRRSNEREMKLEAHQVLDIMEYQLKIRSDILQQSKKSSNKFFISIGNSEFFRSIIIKLVQKLHKQNSKVTSLKQIRASVITHWLKLYNLRQAQYMAGHRFVSSTEAYKINDLEDLSEEIQRYHPIV